MLDWRGYRSAGREITVGRWPLLLVDQTIDTLLFFYLLCLALLCPFIFPRLLSLGRPVGYVSCCCLRRAGGYWNVGGSSEGELGLAFVILLLLILMG